MMSFLHLIPLIFNAYSPPDHKFLYPQSSIANTTKLGKTFLVMCAVTTYLIIFCLLSKCIGMFLSDVKNNSY